MSFRQLWGHFGTSIMVISAYILKIQPNLLAGRLKNLTRSFFQFLAILRYLFVEWSSESYLFVFCSSKHNFWYQIYVSKTFFADFMAKKLKICRFGPKIRIRPNQLMDHFIIQACIYSNSQHYQRVLGSSGVILLPQPCF